MPSDADRREWVTAILAGARPDDDFVRKLDAKPGTVQTHTPAQYFEVCRRERRGVLKIAGVEFGTSTGSGKKKLRTAGGFTFSLSYAVPQQTNLL